MHVASDTRNGFIFAGHVTPANLSDTRELARVTDADQLTNGTRVYADKGGIQVRKTAKYYVAGT